MVSPSQLRSAAKGKRPKNIAESKDDDKDSKSVEDPAIHRMVPAEPMSLEAYEALGRRELQRRCKLKGIRANMANREMALELLKSDAGVVEDGGVEAAEANQVVSDPVEAMSSNSQEAGEVEQMHHPEHESARLIGDHPLAHQVGLPCPSSSASFNQNAGSLNEVPAAAPQAPAATVVPQDAANSMKEIAGTLLYHDCTSAQGEVSPMKQDDKAHPNAGIPQGTQTNQNVMKENMMPALDKAHGHCAALLEHNVVSNMEATGEVTLSVDATNQNDSTTLQVAAISSSPHNPELTQAFLGTSGAPLSLPEDSMFGRFLAREKQEQAERNRKFGSREPPKSIKISNHQRMVMERMEMRNEAAKLEREKKVKERRMGAATDGPRLAVPGSTLASVAHN